MFGIFATDLATAVGLCEEMAQGPDDRLARGARALLEHLVEIDPVLHPAPPSS
ncbi:hypothetical protein LG634_09330 [Streptomyces bambusae]|uniref:hypothetical protein n=1 Tax=Streptomyces bambusae TaxID=1550616 RepID=UPI001CFCF93D|nr:hypothetical protein [Streptomyces bambusae]MCB5165028.1 hypothetical protein [Streptomyces bambusae]